MIVHVVEVLPGGKTTGSAGSARSYWQNRSEIVLPPTLAVRYRNACTYSDQKHSVGIEECGA